MLSKAQCRAIDWASMAPAPAELFDDRLLGRRADHLFVARVKGSRRVVQRHAEAHPGAPQALVVALVVHHGHRPWHAEGSMCGLLDPASGEPVSPLDDFQAGPKILLLDLARATETEVHRLHLASLGRLTALCLQFLRGQPAGAALECLRGWGPLLRQVHAKDPGEGFEAVSCYVLYATRLDAGLLGDLLARLIGPEAKERLMSTGAKIEREARQQGRKEGRELGRAEGLAEGRAEGRADLFLRQVAARFGAPSPQLERRVREAADADVERWAVALVTAQTLEQVFAEQR